MDSRVTENKNLFVTLHENKKIYHAAFWVAVLTFSFLLLIEFLKTKYYYSATDSFYYFSVAKNLHENGIFRDLVTNGRIFTPQNGVVILQYILLKFGFGHDNIFIATTFINYIVLLSTIFPLLVIMKFIGIGSRIAAYSIVAYCLCSWRFLTVLLFPQNDGLYITTTIWLIYLLTWMHQSNYGQIDAGKIRRRIYIISCIAISVTAIHFRLSLIFVPFAGIAASLLVKKFKTIPFMILLSMVMLISLAAPYYFLETDISKFSQSKILYIFADFKGTVLDFCFHAIPASIFRDFKMQSNVLYLPVIFCLLAALITSIKRKEFLKLVVLFVCFMTYGLVLLYGIFNVRYLIVIAPLIFIIMLDSKHFRNIAYLFIFASLSTSLWSYYDGIKLPRYHSFWPHVSETVEFEGEDPMLITAQARSCWFFTGISPQYPQEQWRYWTVPLTREKRQGSIEVEHLELYTWQELIDREYIYLAGLEKFVEFHSSKIKQMAKENNFGIRFEVITSQYREYLVTQVFLEPDEN